MSGQPQTSPWGAATAPPPSRAPYEPPARRAPAAQQDPLMAMLLGDGRREGIAQAFAKSAARSLGGSVVRGLLGSILKR
jgi:hypothetical protein